MASMFGRVELENQFFKRAMGLAVGVHIVALMLELSLPIREIKLPIKQEAIKLTFTPVEMPKPIPKEKILAKESPLKESEIVKVKPKEKVVAGTKKIVPKAKELGNPKAEKIVKNVQKGDPVSKNMTKYKPGTEFRKTPTTNIGTGGTSAIATANLGGGSGDVYKAPNFATKSVSSMAQLGSRFKLKNAADDNGAGAGSSGGVGDGRGAGFGDGIITGSRNGTVETAKMINNVGSLTGVTNGAITSSKGSEGLSTKGSVIVAGVPDDTVVLGSMDPDSIRRKLLEHLSEFRYCYQSELDEKKSKDVSGVVHLNFNIGPEGDVQRANVSSNSGITSTVKSCVAGVLRDIEFPKPRGGGVVEVKQPMNFYPKNS
jgi:outer membrane biosynthesis protein TonB